MADALVFKSIRELGELVKSRQVSPVELAETFLDRLETIGPGMSPTRRPTTSRPSTACERPSCWPAQCDILTSPLNILVQLLDSVVPSPFTERGNRGEVIAP